LKKIVEEINNLEPKFEKFSDEELKNETKKLKNIIKEKRKEQDIPEGNISDLGKEKIKEIQKKEQKILDDILPDGAALVREAAKRTLKQRHFDVQLMGGIVLHQGKISEMKTGEGKTLTATVPLFLNALLGRGAHLITVNDYLAKIHTQWMGKIYDFLDYQLVAFNMKNLIYLKKNQMMLNLAKNLI